MFNQIFAVLLAILVIKHAVQQVLLILFMIEEYYSLIQTTPLVNQQLFLNL